MAKDESGGSMRRIVTSDLLTGLPEEVHAAQELINRLIFLIKGCDVASEEEFSFIIVIRGWVLLKLARKEERGPMRTPWRLPFNLVKSIIDGIDFF